MYAAGSRPIVVDGDLSDWRGLEVAGQTPFQTKCHRADEINRNHAGFSMACIEYPLDPTGTSTRRGPTRSTGPTEDDFNPNPFVLFEAYGGGIWNGIQDFSNAVAFAWQPDALFIGAKVIDDTHQNPGNGWNGDSMQFLFTGPDRDTQGTRYMFNGALSDDGDLIRHGENVGCGAAYQDSFANEGRCRVESAIVRNEATAADCPGRTSAGDCWAVSVLAPFSESLLLVSSAMSLLSFTSKKAPLCIADNHLRVCLFSCLHGF